MVRRIPYPLLYSIVLLYKCSRSIGRRVLTDSQIDSIEKNMTSSIELNLVTGLGALQCHGEENTCHGELTTSNAEACFFEAGCSDKP